MAKVKAKKTAKKKAAKKTAAKKASSSGRPKGAKTKNGSRTAADRGPACIHCGHEFDHKKTNTYPNGNRRVLCGALKDSGCGRPFIIRRNLIS